MNNEMVPPEVLRLFRREREVAQLVYSQRSTTAKEVQARLSDPLTSAAVRSMLNRLVRKGILVRHRNDRGPEYIYRPGISHVASRERAVRQVAEDYFGGSFNEVAASILRLLRGGAGEAVSERSA